MTGPSLVNSIDSLVSDVLPIGLNDGADRLQVTAIERNGLPTLRHRTVA